MIPIPPISTGWCSREQRREGHTSWAARTSLDVCQIADPRGSIAIPEPDSFCCLIHALKLSAVVECQDRNLTYSICSIVFCTPSGRSENFVDLLIPDEELDADAF